MTCDVFSRDMCGEIALVKNMESKIMEELFNFLSEWAGWIFGFFAAAFAVRGSIKFDVNVWLNDRRKRIKDNLKAMCPHVRPFVEDGINKMQSTFISPPGTAAWQCQRCGRVTYDTEEIELNCKYWAENPDDLAERNKKMEKLAKKLG